jgi:peptidylprolyl isomerase
MNRPALLAVVLLGAASTVACGEAAPPPPAAPPQASQGPTAADTAAAAPPVTPDAAPPPAPGATPDSPAAAVAATPDAGAASAHGPPPAPADVAAPPSDAQKTASGLAYRLLRASADPKAKHPRRMSVVTVHYTGWTTDGKMFDSSLTDGTPAEFPLDRVIPGWTEGLQLMKVGDAMRFWIPGALAYDNPKKKAREGVPHGMLVFDVELLGVK